MRYDRARVSLDRRATYMVSTYIAGAARLPGVLAAAGPCWRPEPPASEHAERRLGRGVGPAGVTSAPCALSQIAGLLDLHTVSETRLILTCGLPGAGKTTLATQLASKRSAVRLTKDEWLWALGSTPWDNPPGRRSNGSSGAWPKRS
jgi:hypothetical protein